jgi:4-diphosphocytidyl-2-C-methyl-D-erythritol kinase
MQAYGLQTEIVIKKRIPVCAVSRRQHGRRGRLRWARRALRNPSRRRSLESLGESLGSDVPFCVAGGSALAKGAASA